jgi:hypothetical protein
MRAQVAGLLSSRPQGMLSRGGRAAAVLRVMYRSSACSTTGRVSRWRQWNRAGVSLASRGHSGYKVTSAGADRMLHWPCRCPSMLAALTPEHPLLPPPAANAPAPVPALLLPLIAHLVNGRVLAGGGGSLAVPPGIPGQASQPKDVKHRGPAPAGDHLRRDCQPQHAASVHAAVDKGQRAAALPHRHPPAQGGRRGQAGVVESISWLAG